MKKCTPSLPASSRLKGLDVMGSAIRSGKSGSGKATFGAGKGTTARIMSAAKGKGIKK